MQPFSRAEIVHSGYQGGFELDHGEDDAGWVVLGTSQFADSFRCRSTSVGVELIYSSTLVSSELQKEFGSEFYDARNGALLSETHDIYRLMRRAFALSISLPDTPLQKYQALSKGLPSSTEAERMVLARIGQDVFRDALMTYWKDACPLTGIRDKALLRASHVKPWVASTDTERLDVFNGLLLAVHWDAAFDKHLVTFDSAGFPFFANRLSDRGRAFLVSSLLSPRIDLGENHQIYLEIHREEFNRLDDGLD